MKDFIQKNKKLVGAGSAIGVLIVGFLAFGVFGIHTAFIDNEVSEAGPVFASGASADQPVTTATSDDGTEDEAMEEEDDEAMEDEGSEPADDASAPQIQTIASGSFTASSSYDGTGDINVLTDGNQTFLRFEENFSSDNGPDLNVYLRANDGSGEFIDLGDLKGNIGSQNYEIPADVDLSRFSEVEIWCVRFGVGFITADLMST